MLTMVPNSAVGRAQNCKSQGRMFEPKGVFIFLSFFTYFVIFFFFSNSSRCNFEDSVDQSEKNFHGSITSTLSDIVTFYQ